MTHIQVRVVNEFGKDVGKDGVEQGEIIVKGLGIMSENTKEDGWFYTGDQGTIDESGNVQIIEAHKDMMNPNGENISSVEVENIFHKHPAIEEIAVIVVPDEKLGEVLHAFVVLKANHHITEQELIEFAKQHFSSTNFSASFTFMDELPKTRSGKILKMQLMKHR